eukprot:scaffold85426_cov23-Cyclotella_meneghiniana.AAC.5
MKAYSGHRPSRQGTRMDMSIMIFEDGRWLIYHGCGLRGASWIGREAGGIDNSSHGITTYHVHPELFGLKDQIAQPLARLKTFYTYLCMPKLGHYSSTSCSWRRGRRDRTATIKEYLVEEYTTRKIKLNL